MVFILILEAKENPMDRILTLKLSSDLCLSAPPELQRVIKTTETGCSATPGCEDSNPHF
jgi:hypothetical protein